MFGLVGVCGVEVGFRVGVSWCTLWVCRLHRLAPASAMVDSYRSSLLSYHQTSETAKH